MKTKILLLLFGLASLFGHAQQTKSQTETQIDTLIPTNNNRQVTALKLRNALKAVVNYAQPSNLETGAISLDKISTSGATLNQVIKFNGTAWAPGNDVSGGGGGGATWGAIPGTLADQTDLMAKFATKSDTGHTHSTTFITEGAKLFYSNARVQTFGDTRYQPIGSYLTSINSGNVTTALGFTPYNATNPAGYITSSAISGKLNIADTTGLLPKVTAAATYQVKGNYLTSINSGNVTTALGFTPYNATNPSGYITSSALSSYLTSSTAASTYQPIGSYITNATAAATYQPIGSYLTSINSSQVTTALGFTPYNASNPSGYITISALSPYLTSSTAAATYQPIGSYLTSITSGNVTTALGFTPYNASNPSGYITSSALSPYLTSSTAASTYQPLDTDLTTMAGLTPTTDNFVVASASAWASRTPAQARTSLGATTIGSSMLMLANPGAITFPRFNADNTVSSLDASSYRTALGLGTLATQSGTFSGTSSGTNTGDQTITLTGDITGSGTGSFVTTIATGVIVNADLNASAAIGATKLIDGSVSDAELGYINTLSSNAQTQIDTKHPNVQYKDEGSNLGSSGGITSINFTGPGTIASYSGANLTVDTKDYESLVIAASDRTTAITTGTDKETIPMPFAMTVTEVRAYLGTAQTSGSLFTVDIMENGVSILSTKITFDNTEKGSYTAVTLPVISDTVLAKNSEIRIDVTQIGNGTAKDLKITIDGYRN